MSNQRNRVVFIVASLSLGAGYAYWLKRRPVSRSAQTPESTDDSAPIVEPLTMRVISRRIDDVFREGYLTLLAIIQGVALGLFLTSMYMHWQADSGTWVKLRLATQGAAVLGAIIVVTHRYIVLMVLVRWIPTFFDTLIPYLLGVGEISASITLGSDVGWWASVAFYSLSAAICYIYSRRRTSVNFFQNTPGIYLRFRKVSRLAIVLLLMLFGISALLILLKLIGVANTPLYAITPLFCMVVNFSIETYGNYNFGASAGK